MYIKSKIKIIDDVNLNKLEEKVNDFIQSEVCKRIINNKMTANADKFIMVICYLDELPERTFNRKTPYNPRPRYNRDNFNSYNRRDE